MNRRTVYIATATFCGTLLVSGTTSALTPTEQLGKSIFFDKSLSLKKNQSCATCHDPDVGWTGPVPGINKKGAVYPGSVKTRFGNRKPPSAAYATDAPVLHWIDDEGDALFIGGNFWDGRATGEELGNPSAEQARGPFLNPVEQALPDKACVVFRVCNPSNTNAYPVKMTDVYPGTCEQIVWPATVEASCKAGKLVDLSDEARDYVDEAYNDIAYAIADYEASAEVNQFSSRYDAYLAGDETALTNQEVSGLLLFTGEALCSACHLAEQREDGEPPLFTDYTFDNLGVPKNPDNPEYVENPGFIDEGLGGFLATRTDGWHAYAAQNRGKHKVPTLRNVALSPGKGFTKAFMHNGYFKTLEGVVHFYNTRDVNPSCESLGLLDATEAQALKNNCWPDPEVAENVNSDELGDLGLTPEQEAALVAFMRALSDGYVPKPGKAPTR